MANPIPCWVSFLLLLEGSAALAQTAEPGAQLKIVGSEEVVFNWRKDACDPMDIPDMDAHAFRNARGQVQLIAINWPMIGPDLNHVKNDCHQVLPSHGNPNPAKYDDQEWLQSTYTSDGKTVYALIHDEYHGWEHPGQCSPETIRNRHFGCWYNVVTLGVSTDGGGSYRHAVAPRHLVASIPYRYALDQGHTGVFHPSNIIYSPEDHYYYSFIWVIDPEHRQFASVMRAQTLSDPASWRCWDGEGFNVRFIDPYVENGAPQGHMCQALDRKGIGNVNTIHVAFSTSLNRYLIVGTSLVRNPETGKNIRAFCYSFSDDLIHWTPLRFLKEVVSAQDFKPGDPDPVAYPSVLDPASPSRNFETTGKRFYLYYTHYNYGRYGKPRTRTESLDRDLVRVPVEFLSAKDAEPAR